MDGDVNTIGAFTSSITGLTPGLLYHVRAYATNAVDTVYGEDVTFTTLPSTTGTTTPSTNSGIGANVPGTGTADWANPSYITADDTSYASATLVGSILTSSYLEGTHYGFDIPTDAAINGIQVTIGRHESGSTSGSFDVRDNVVRLLKAGVLTGDNKAATGTEWPIGSPVPAVYGTTADLWGTTWTPAEINADNFGVALSVISNVNRIAYVDYVQISVTYTVTMVGSNTTVDCGAGTPLVTYGSDITCVATVVRGSGDKTPSGNVSWTTDGDGTFVTSPCVLSGSNGTSTCSVTYTPSSVGDGSHLITATYAGDENFFSSNGNQTVTVDNIVTHSIPLVAGWNLISFKVHPENTAVATVLASIDGNYDLIYAWDATVTSNNWLLYDPAMPPFLNSLDHLDETMGFWIHMTTADTLDITGTIPVTTNINLSTTAGGWNLVGYPSTANRLLPAALSDNGVGTDFSLVYAYHADDDPPWKLFDVDMPPFLNSLTELSPGWGYWVKVTADHSWSVEYLGE